MVRRGYLVLYLLVVLVVPDLCGAAEPKAFLLIDFERSPFFQKHTLVSKSDLHSGGNYFYYTFADPENAYSGMGVEVIVNPANVVHNIAVLWYGKSIYEPASFTRPKEAFLRDLLRSTFSEIKPDVLIAYVRGQGGKNYPGGGSAMPRKRLNGVSVFCGTVGEGLIVGMER